MGTRNLTAVYVNGEYKIAQYAQYDGEPDGQGVVALKFCKNTDLKVFGDKCQKIKWINPEKLTEMWRSYGSDENGFIGYDKALKFEKDYPHLDRYIGANILSFIMESEGEVELRNNINFAGDSLFCEWAYVIDLDKGTFEVYQGFNKNPLTDGERFKNIPSDNNRGYYPIFLLKSYLLNDLPDEERFIQECYPDDE